MIGYSEESKGYKMVNPLDMKITIRCDVVFEEDECWNWGRTDSETTNNVLDWGEDCEETFYDVDRVEINTDNVENNTREEETEYDDNNRSSSNGITTSPILDKRIRRALSYLEDYTSGEGISDDELQISSCSLPLIIPFCMRKQLNIKFGRMPWTQKLHE